MTSCFEVGPYRMYTEGEQGGFAASLSGVEVTRDVWVVTLELTSPTPAVPAPDLRVMWRVR